MARGRLITIEGIDGAGKSMLARALLEELSQRHAHVELLREPGGVALAEHVRVLVKDPGLAIAPRAETLLYAAARAQLVQERVQPLLTEGAVVVLDRFVDSSLAYQGAGRGLGVEQVLAVNRFATGGLVPDCTLLLRVSPATARARLVLRDKSGVPHEGSDRAEGDSVALTEGSDPPSGIPDRFEREDESFFETIATAYETLASQAPERVHVLDAERPASAVLAEALAALDAARLDAAGD